jgi:hypothetical protein
VSPQRRDVAAEPRGGADLSGKVVAGGAGGAALIRFAEVLPRPWKDLLVLTTPAFVSLYVALWPRIMNSFDEWWKRYRWKRDRDEMLGQLSEIIAGAKKAERELRSGESLQTLKEEIAKLENVHAKVLTAPPLSYAWLEISVNRPKKPSASTGAASPDIPNH